MYKHGDKRPSSIAMVFISAWTALSALVLAQESPRLKPDRWTNSANYKTFLCEQQERLWRGDIELPDALRGINISVSMTMYSSQYEREYFHLNDKGQIDRYNPGLYVVVLDHVAELAGFSWRDRFGVNPPPDPEIDGNRTWTDLLLWSLEVYDLSVDYWLKSVSRMAMGVYFPESFLDASIILVEPQVSKENENVDIWAFFAPFEFSVWILIVVGIVVTGLMYWTLEKLNQLSDERNLDSVPGDAVFYAAVTFTQHFEFRPQTHSARLLSFSWAFWAVIVGSAYTANLASFLVAKRQPSYAMMGLDEIVRHQAPLCVHATSVSDEFITEKFPDANIIRKFREQETLTALHTGECSVSAVSLSVWELFERVASVNHGCTLRSMGEAIKIVPASFATSVDSGGTCSSLIGHVLDYHFSNMKADGTLERIWKEHLNRVGDQNCEVTSEDSKESVQPFSIRDMGGIFMLHAIMSAVAVLLALFGRIVRDKNLLKTPTKAEGEGSVMAEKAMPVDDDDLAFVEQINAPNSHNASVYTEHRRDLFVRKHKQHTEELRMSTSGQHIIKDTPNRIGNVTVQPSETFYFDEVSSTRNFRLRRQQSVFNAF